MSPKRVIVEVKQAVAASAGEAIATAANLPCRAASFKLDEQFEPLPSHRPVHHYALFQMDVREEESLFLRGAVEPEEEQELSRDPNVVAVWNDAPIVPFDMAPGSSLVRKPGFVPCKNPDCDYYTPKGGVREVVSHLGVDAVWKSGYRGKGIVIGICDTGVKRSDVSAVIDGWTSNSSIAWGTDQQGHGTMCASDALAVCPEAKILDIGALKNTGSGFSGFVSDAILAYEWAIQRHRRDGTPHILSNSWGMYQKSWAEDYATDPRHPFTLKVQQAIREGLIVCFAAGNCGDQCPDGRCGDNSGHAKSIWGANGHEEVITVGAANIRGEWAGYSSQGPAALYDLKPDFCAPSHFTGYNNCDTGTSASCPVCAGVIGLLKQARPALRQAQVRQALARTALNLCAPGWDYQTGAGMIQAYAALKVLQPKGLGRFFRRERY